MRRPSILFINRVYPPVHGATGRVLRELARSFAREGWQVTVITTGPKALKERDGAVRIIRVKGPEKPGGMFGYLWVLFKMFFVALRLPATHLLVTMTDPPFLAVAGNWLKGIKKNKHMHWCHDVYPDLFPALGVKMPGFMRRYMGRAVRKAMRQSDKVIVIGRCMARHLSYTGLDPRHMTVVPNWPNVELARPVGKGGFNDASYNADIDAAFRSPGGGGAYRSHEEQVKAGPKFRVLYAGNIGRAHPVETILGAAEILNEMHPEIEFLFVGDGPGHDFISNERSKRHLDNIKLLPFQPASRLRELMESGDVHLVSMKEEAAGMLVPSKLYSALAVHRPCILIGPAQSETAKVITDFKAGDVVGQGDIESLVARICDMRLNGDVWFSAQEGAAQAGQTFVPKASINAWIERAWSVLEPDQVDRDIAA